ncbi:MAG: TIM barrel protein [Anaerolineae bacterium]|nr:TIM barrel protein [Anaerolineae bacterium]
MASSSLDPIRFGTVGSPQTTPTSGTVAAIEHIRLLGLEHLEIAWVRSVRVTDQSCDEIAACGARQGISLSVHAPYFINLNSQTVDLMTKSDERLLAAARKGWRAGARDIVFHPGSYHNQPPEQVYERVKEKLLEIRSILDAEGIDVTLRPETMGKPAMIGDLDELLALSRDIPGVLPCIDFAHLHARGGLVNTYDEFAGVFRRVEAALGRRGLETLHAHLSGIEYGPRGERHHLPLNECDLNYRELLQAMIDFDVHGTVAVEAPIPFHVADALTLQATYRRLRDRQPAGDGEGEEDGVSDEKA